MRQPAVIGANAGLAPVDSLAGAGDCIMNTILPSGCTTGVPMVPSWHDFRPLDHLALCASRVATAQDALRPGGQPIADAEIELADTWHEGRPIEICRRQMAILAGDVAGYSRLIESDDVGTVARLRFLRRRLFDPMAALFDAALIRHTADAILLAFEDPADALGCAIALQSVMLMLNKDAAEGRSIRLRIGLSVGEVLFLDDDVHGTGVNIAARLEALAGAGEIYLCERAVDHVRHVLPLVFEPVGKRRLHNISTPVRAFRVALDVIGRIAHAVPAANELAAC
jgi:class 3 adenylate cyclase